MSTTRGWVLVALVALVAGALALFTIYSFSLAVENWPWTQTTHITSGEYLGFKAGSTRETTFEQAMKSQQRKEIGIVLPLNGPSTTTANRFRGYRLTTDDYELFRQADRWHISIPDCACWGELVFEGDRLMTIDRKRYFGPSG